MTGVARNLPLLFVMVLAACALWRWREAIRQARMNVAEVGEADGGQEPGEVRAHDAVEHARRPRAGHVDGGHAIGP